MTGVIWILLITLLTFDTGLQEADLHFFFGILGQMFRVYSLALWMKTMLISRVTTFSFFFFALSHSSGVGISRQSLPVRSVMHLISRQPLLTQIFIYTIFPFLLWSTSPSLASHFQSRNFLSYVVLLSSMNMSVPLQPSFLYFLPKFNGAVAVG
jgi:hypothetical protein